MNRILVAVDGSECSRVAFEYSLDEVEELDNQLTVLRVVPSFGYAGGAFKEALNEEIENAEEFLAKLENRAKKRGMDIDTEVLVGTDVANEIVKFADEKDFDLITVGSRGKTELETISLGSVSEGVVKRAHCPVLVVR